MKKVFTIIVSVLFVFSSAIPIYAKTEPLSDDKVMTFFAEELEEGVEIPLYLENGKIVAGNEALMRSVQVGAFSVKLKRQNSSDGYLHWSVSLIAGSGTLSKVIGKMYCESLNVLSKKVYCSTIISASRLSGTQASGTSYSFSLPKKEQRWL